ncbi:hypothetical protein E1B28_013883 [Marasmius oreades]|uniref:Retroviral polymerase SH3-like domain-containing protein n=1 Tax=Marasmius oreades TaxID=181124 RepID=A0A9P7ULG6_9AGAR|nr:uncharacterized protein E1B28_013870 [Marasmius oreades]XP_043001747.1 uncharacterized protein E1B28_013883 [Marasmius oreades]KAG7085259.1 hypothetical protein E1B28_013870 [Marasmius oreades]KAG7085276.1 hypothetical protein E1B28_013883 [Marasmius oreades]
MLGYLGRRGYRLWVPETRSVIESRDVQFEEGTPHRTLPVDRTSDLDVQIDFDVEVGNPVEPIHYPTPDAVPLPLTDDHGPVTAPEDAVAMEEPIPPPVERIQPSLASNRTRRLPIPSRAQRDMLEMEEMEKDVKGNKRDWATDTSKPREGVLYNPNQAHMLIINSPWAFASTMSREWVLITALKTTTRCSKTHSKHEVRKTKPNTSN